MQIKNIRGILVGRSELRSFENGSGYFAQFMLPELDDEGDNRMIQCWADENTGIGGYDVHELETYDPGLELGLEVQIKIWDAKKKRTLKSITT